MENKMKFHWTNRLKVATFITVLIFLAATSVKAQDGKSLFKANCASCHKVLKNSTGPMLQGAKARWADAGEAEKIYEWVKNPVGLANSGTSPYAVQISEYSPTAMTAQGHLSNEEIDAILDYADSVKPVAKTAVASSDVAGEEEQGEGGSLLWIILLIVVFSVVIFAARGVRKQLAYVVAEKEGEELDLNKSVKEKLGQWIVRNWKFTTIAFVLLVVTGGADLMKRGFQVGVYADYMPSQPINYSHKLHAGEMGIDCKYCHNSAEKSKHAGIPTVNVCMNCHENIVESDYRLGSTENIAKIHDAAGYDAETRKYTGNTSPIVWNKAHNLPDHVFFSHAQHVSKETGNIDCKQCHGNVPTYGLGRVSTTEEINQLAGTDGIIALTKPLLTMGWCLECHNEKSVDLTKSDYYKELHTRLKSRPDFLRKISEDDKITVRELGGWECAKCHY
jgi:mono/diheme cytochrome c family protein